MSRREVVFPALILAFIAVMLAIGALYYHYSWTAFAFPLAAGLAVFLLCAFEITTLLRGRGARAPGAAVQPPLSLSAIAWLFALAAFLFGFGFVFGAALYLLICLRGNGFSWRLSLGTATVSLFVTWGLFIKVLRVQLPIAPFWMG